MPDDILISELSNAPQIDDSAVFPFTQDNGGSPATFKAPMSQIAGKVGEGTTFANLQTTSKKLVGAINELKAGGGGSTELIGTASGSIATFSDGGNNIPMKSCEVAIVAQQASGTPSPSNPLPITGFSSVNVVDCGKNLLDVNNCTIVNGAIGETEINYTPSSSSYIMYLPKGTYTISINSSSSTIFRVCTINTYPTGTSFSIPANNVNRYTTGVANCTITNSSDRWLVIQTNQTVVEARNAQIQVEKGNQATAYTAYTGTTTPVSLGQTIYGGTAELVGGNGSKTWGEVNLGDLTWTYNSTYQVFISTGISDKAFGVKNIICSHYSTNQGASWNTLQNEQISGHETNYTLYIKDTDRGTDPTTFKTWLSTNNVKAIYELATPTAFTFTGANIPTLSGVNNVYANSGDVDLEYFNENADEIAELINVYPYEVSGVLTAGQTSITLSSGLIKADSTIDVYTSDGTNYNSVSVSSGSVTITFDAQVSNLGVKVRVS